MNLLNFIIDENKFRIINKFKFSITFWQLKHYLNLTEWFQKYVKNYVKISELLQNKKIVFLKKLFIIESIQRFFSTKTLLQNSIEKKILFCKILQKQLFISHYFAHCSFVRQFYLNVDINKKKTSRWKFIILNRLSAIIRSKSWLNQSCFWTEE